MRCAAREAGATILVPMPVLGLGRPNVRRLKRRGDLEGLRQALRYRQVSADAEGNEWDLTVDVRAEAAAALADFEASEISDDLAAALGDPHPAVRSAALETTSRLGTAVAVERLLDCIVDRRDEDDEFSERALDVLVAWRVEGAAEGCAEQLVRPGAPPLDDRHREALDRLLGADGRGETARNAVIDAVVARLRDPEADTEDRASRVLRWLGPGVVESVVASLADGKATPGMVRAAGLLGDARTIGPVIRGMSSPDSAMRTSAAAAAGKLNHTQAVPALLSATQDQEQAVRDAASEALDRMGTAAVIAGLAALTSPGEQFVFPPVPEALRTAMPELPRRKSAQAQEPASPPQLDRADDRASQEEGDEADRPPTEEHEQIPAEPERMPSASIALLELESLFPRTQEALTTESRIGGTSPGDNGAGAPAKRRSGGLIGRMLRRKR